MNTTTKLVDYLKSISMFFQKLDEPYIMARQEIDTLLHILSKVKDFRQKGKIVYKLELILGICFYLALKGKFTSFHYASTYVDVHKEEFEALGLIENGRVPSHDTFLNIFNNLDALSLRDAFIEKFRQFLESAYNLVEDKSGKYKLLSGDGKTFNGSGRKGGRANFNVFNMYSGSSAICSISVPLTNKDSEIPEFQKLLTKLDLRKTIVTADALHCQRKTCEIIISRKGHYLIKAKDNHVKLVDEIEQSFINPKYSKKIAKLHHNDCDYEIILISDIISDVNWPGCKAYVKMISYKRADQSDFNPVPQYFVTSLKDITLIAEAADNRWDIEDGLHYFKDDFLNEDSCTFTGKNAVQVMATINNIVYAFYRIAAAILNDTMTRTIMRYEENPLELISIVTPLLKKTNFNALVRNNMRGVKKPE